MPYTDVIPTSASIASTGLGIRYIGNRCYAFSGAFAASASVQTLLDFTTGSGFIVATLTMTAPIRMVSANIGGGYTRGYQIDFNSQTVGLYKVESSEHTWEQVTPILIPPLTKVVLSCVDGGTSASYSGTAHLTGRVYGAE